MKITHKFFLFGLIPSVAQAVICVQLFSLLTSVEYYAEQEAKQNLIARTLVAGMAQSIEAVLAAGAYQAAPIDELGKRVKLASDRVDLIFGDLRTMTKDDPTAHAEIEELLGNAATVRTAYLVANRVPVAADADSLINGLPLKDLKNGQLLIRRVRKMTQILERQNTKLAETRSKQKSSRASVVRLIWAELILSVVVIALLCLLFRYDLGRRFNNLMQIAQDLALDRTPSKTITGKDELADLSQALLIAAKARREAEVQKQTLFQMVTHDLRSPLMAASLVLETMLADKSETEEQKQKRLRAMDRSLKRVVNLANDLLTKEILDAGGMEINRASVDFRETVEKALDTVRPLADHKKCLLQNQTPSLNVSIDEDRILQVTINLLANAIKFSPPGAAVEVAATIDSNRLRVEVKDRGPGIDEKQIQKLFNPFQQGDDSKTAGGFGLGLAIAKSLVELHDGSIGARARAGGGTIFWYTLRL